MKTSFYQMIPSLGKLFLPDDVALDIEDVQLRIDRPIRLLNDGAEVRRVRIDFDGNHFAEIGYFIAQRNLEIKKIKSVKNYLQLKLE